jgi:hypothetical protein
MAWHSRGRALFIDLTGRQINEYLTAVAYAGPYKSGGGAAFSCACKCGRTKIIASRELRAGKTLSCGCHRSRRMTLRNQAANAALKALGIK